MFSHIVSIPGGENLINTFDFGALEAESHDI